MDEPFQRITIDEARRLLESGAAYGIDVREPDEWGRGHIAGVRHVPLGQILSRPHQHITADNVVFICAVGVRSATASEMAAALGFGSIYNMEGGMEAWERSHFPVER